jgi:Uma2 family endonuclease
LGTRTTAAVRAGLGGHQDDDRGTLDHNRITLNVADTLRQRLSGGDCEVFVNDVKVVTQAGDVMYPDVVVACGELPGKASVLDAPVVTVEVLSESTAERDHGRKRRAYQTIPSLRHYVLVDQDEGGVEVTSPNEDGTWRSVILRDLNDRLRLTALKVEIGLEEVFARVTFRRVSQERPRGRLVTRMPRETTCSA